MTKDTYRRIILRSYRSPDGNIENATERDVVIIHLANKEPKKDADA